MRNAKVAGRQSHQTHLETGIGDRGDFQMVNTFLGYKVESPEREEDGDVNSVAKCRLTHDKGGVSHIQIAFGADKCDLAVFFSHDIFSFYVLHPKGFQNL